MKAKVKGKVRVRILLLPLMELIIGEDRIRLDSQIVIPPRLQVSLKINLFYLKYEMSIWQFQFFEFLLELAVVFLVLQLLVMFLKTAI
jgi:hypothetical protein